jgi:serine/threonine protein kinase
LFEKKFEDADGIWHAFKAETRMLKTLQHPNVARYLGSYFSKESREINVIIEFLEGGSLANLIRHDGPFTERFAARVAFQILEGLHFLHSNHIFHRDLTPNNVVLNKMGIGRFLFVYSSLFIFFFLFLNELQLTVSFFSFQPN